VGTAAGPIRAAGNEMHAGAVKLTGDGQMARGTTASSDRSGASRYAQAAPPAAPAAPAAPAQNPQPQPPQPQRTEILRFENWTASCNYYNEGAKKQECAARLQVQQSGTNQILLSWIVSANDKKQFVSELQTPTGVAIAPGVEIEFDKKTKHTLTYESCDTGHCTATAVMDNTFIRDLSAAQNAQVAVHAMNGQTLNFDFPVKGFDKAYAQLRSSL
jgi:invasion protein IalB